ncbi:hypothetical protein RRG08_021028 [Elysia crispata]|uniref:Uncharacterized protein n=1 Tax=Elysia crispata TaxID=231223 RepID=A0AAE0ZTG3_9GAST|nr:hypothetical protein RRG08_021028 [Elysia crispata]
MRQQQGLLFSEPLSILINSVVMSTWPWRSGQLLPHTRRSKCQSSRTSALTPGLAVQVLMFESNEVTGGGGKGEEGEGGG